MCVYPYVVKHLKRIILISLIIFPFVSCTNSYEVSKEKLNCRFGLDQGFELSELTVTEFDSLGEPKKFKVVNTIYYGSNHKDETDKDSFKTFYFNKSNGKKGYEWKWYYFEGKSRYETLPFEFKNNIWYSFSFSHQSCYHDDLFFKFHKNGKVVKFHSEGNCGAAW